MEKAKIQSISRYHYFKPEETGYRTQEFQGTGPGKLIPYQPQDFQSGYDILLPFQDELSPKTTNHLMKEKGRNVTTKISCSDAECVEVFDYERDLEIHLNLGKHSYTNQTDERHSTNDKVKILFAKKLKEASFSHCKQQENL